MENGKLFLFQFTKYLVSGFEFLKNLKNNLLKIRNCKKNFLTSLFKTTYTEGR